MQWTPRTGRFVGSSEAGKVADNRGESNGPRKKEIASVMLRQLFGKFNIDISEDLLDHLIEAAVQTVNSEAGKFGPIISLEEATVGGSYEPPSGLGLHPGSSRTTPEK